MITNFMLSVSMNTVTGIQMYKNLFQESPWPVILWVEETDLSIWNSSVSFQEQSTTSWKPYFSSIDWKRQTTLDVRKEVQTSSLCFNHFKILKLCFEEE